MLGAMFSGNYQVQRDKDGRYFVDADGDNFEHILRYLRFADLPPPDSMEKVYKDAVFFGLTELAEELERYPPIMSRIMKEKFRSRFTGYHEAFNEIICAASDSCNLAIKTPTSNVIVSVLARWMPPAAADFDVNHICSFDRFSGTKSTADVTIGPWDVDTFEDDYIRTLHQNLEERGFVVVYNVIGPCQYRCELADDSNIARFDECRRMFYRFTFHWARSLTAFK
ncbi:BTB/POZ domain-containing protein KCTD7-like isoform X2 [Gigantopelta aegis]|nr:BTB/POZ domain-containing protein KCTD7-like isoform X2 [Gigantopelta aegis]